MANLFRTLNRSWGLLGAAIGIVAVGLTAAADALFDQTSVAKELTFASHVAAIAATFAFAGSQLVDHHFKESEKPLVKPARQVLEWLFGLLLCLHMLLIVWLPLERMDDRRAFGRDEVRVTYLWGILSPLGWYLCHHRR
ncbi:hypothetical protein [Schlesneria sp. DSM 10557]|uniref:hypothetical protein n=1 Tax=Schlesneria sp. DSM 10557 TaxID=3044399 RepID=UPI0035A1AA6B